MLQRVHDDLASNLDRHRTLLSTIVEEYGRLSSTTVPSLEHTHLKHENAALQLQVIRLERKLANVESQVVELVHLARFAKQENEDLKEAMKDAENEIRFRVGGIQDKTSPWTNFYEDYGRTVEDATELEKDMLAIRAQMQESRAQEMETTAKFYSLMCEDFMFLSKVADRTLSVEAKLVAQQATELENTVVDRNALAVQLEASQSQLAQMTASLQDVKELRRKVSEAEAQIKEAVQKEKEVNRRHALTAQKHRMVEGALNAELEQ